MPKARIYLPAKTAMQSGRLARKWVLEYEPSDRKSPDALMGWNGSKDTLSQLRLKFDSKEEAVGYAERKGISFTVTEAKPVKPLAPKNYADNFAFNRVI